MRNDTTATAFFTPAPTPDNLTPAGPEQLSLRFFAAVDGMGGNPPDRALWRELLRCALRGVTRFRVGVRTVSAADVHHVALVLYMRANRSGVVEKFAIDTIAADTEGRSERTCRSALQILNQLHVFKSLRASRRRPACHRMNVGGLDWPAVRERLKADRDSPSAVQGTGLSAVQGTALKGYVQGLPDLPHLNIEPDPARAAAEPPTRETSSSDRDRRSRRLAGLISAIACRTRLAGDVFTPDDEASIRASVKDGTTTVEDLQRQADELKAEAEQAEEQAEENRVSLPGAVICRCDCGGTFHRRGSGFPTCDQCGNNLVCLTCGKGPLWGDAGECCGEGFTSTRDWNAGGNA